VEEIFSWARFFSPGGLNSGGGEKKGRNLGGKKITPGGEKNTLQEETLNRGDASLTHRRVHTPPHVLGGKHHEAQQKEGGGVVKESTPTPI